MRKMSIFLWNFLIFNTVFFTSFVGSQELCKDLIKYTEEGDTKVGSLDIYLGQTADNSVAQVNIFVTDECKESSCKLVPQLTLRRIKALYSDFERVPYKIVFSGPAKNATVKAIGFRNSNECKILCKHTNKLKSAGKIMRYAFFPNGHINSKVADCSLYKTYGKVGITAGHIRTKLPVADCGVPALLPIELAIRGMRTEKGQWPWLVDIEVREGNDVQFICGGTLVNQRVVVTAAHCLHNENNDHKPFAPNELAFFLGRYNRSDFNEKTYVQYGVAGIVIHPDYRPGSGNFDADIAFLITDKIVEYTAYIKPACIWDGSDSIHDVFGEEGTVVGWGIDETGNSTNIPYKVHGKIVSEEDCERSYESIQQITTRRNFCAGNDGISTPCKGDSGGAFLLKKDNKWMLRGIVSATFPAMDNQAEVCDVEKHSIYTDIAKFKIWLDIETSKYYDKNYN